MWNQRYSEPGFAYGTTPNEFLVQQSAKITVGPVLCLAEGEGRNAVYLATCGYAVTAVDQSAVGMHKALGLAKERGVSITTVVSNLETFQIEPSSWNGIVSIFAHVPPQIRARLHQQVVCGLKPGGVLLLEAYTPEQLCTGGVGGPRRGQEELFMNLDILREELEGLSFEIAQELEREVNEGRYHHGKGAVVQILAIKK